MACEGKVAVVEIQTGAAIEKRTEESVLFSLPVGFDGGKHFSGRQSKFVIIDQAKVCFFAVCRKQSAGVDREGIFSHDKRACAGICARDSIYRGGAGYGKARKASQIYGGTVWRGC